VILDYTGRECDVSPYTESYDAIKNVPIVTAATSWTSPHSGQVYVLILNEGLWMGDHLDGTLVNQNQCRFHGIEVQDNPFSDSPLSMMTEDEGFTIPLEIEGTTIFAETRTPTMQELDECPKIVLSSPHPWDPMTV
jgi:hypothetical protein